MRRAVAAALALAGLVVCAEALFRLAGRADAPVVVDIGPSTGAYLDGFSDSEERPPTTFRWTRARATLRLPLLAEAGIARLSLHHHGHLRGPQPVHVSAGGARPGSLATAAGPFRVDTIPLALPAGPLQLDLLPEGPPDPGVALDWVRLTGARARIPVSVLGPRLLVAGVFLLALLGGSPLPIAFGLGLLTAGAEALWAALDPFACAHVLERVAWPALALGGVTLFVFRRRPHARWVALLALASVVSKGAALHHPSYFYNDVRNNRRFVQALAGEEGTLLERAHAAQLRYGVAYPRVVGGKKYAFPYSVVFFLPFTALPQDAQTLDDALKTVVVLVAGAEVPFAFALAGLALGPGAGLGAAFVAALLPVLVSRLLLALWATLGGHLCDLALLAAALALAARPDSRPRLVAFAAAAWASLLVYVASLFNVTLFLFALALVERRLALRALAVWALGVALTLGLLYRDFVATFVVEILPALVAGGSLGAAPGATAPGLLAGLWAEIDRVRIFYGLGITALAAAGGALLRRRAAPPAARVLAAFALALLGLMVLRALPGGLLKDLKEMEFATPLACLGAGTSLEALAERGRAGRIAALLLAASLLVFAVARYADWVSDWTRLAGL